MAIRYCFSVSFFVLTKVLFGQFSPGVEFDVGFLAKDKLESYTISDYNKNETITVYKVDNELNGTWSGVSIRNFGSQFTSKNKYSIGYSLGIGYRQFKTSSRLSFVSSSSSYRDSIISRLHHARFQTKYQIISMNHYLDFHWNASETIKISNSLAFNLSTIVRFTSPNTTIRTASIKGELPLFKLFYEFQITEKYKRCSISYYSVFDIYSFELLKKSASNNQFKSVHTPFYSLRFNAIGLRIMPHLKRAKPILPYEAF